MCGFERLCHVYVTSYLLPVIVLSRDEMITASMLLGMPVSYLLTQLHTPQPLN